MNLGSRTALGIDICNGRINLVLLERSKSGIRLLKAATATMPQGAVKNGSIEDPTLLSHALRELKTRNKIGWTNRAAVSLLARPAIIQIIDLPKQLPANIRHFVHDQVKRCVALSGKKIAFDFCRLSPGKGHENKILVVAADEQKVAELAEVCGRAGLNINALEHPLLAYARAFRASRITGKFDSNVLMAIFQGPVLTICVFRNQTLDFVRTKDLGPEKRRPDEVRRRLAEEIKDVIRFYDFEISGGCHKWEITVVADRDRLPPNAAESLSSDVAAAAVRVRTDEDAFEETIVGQNVGAERPSALAIGLALRILDTNGDHLRINLVPPESAEVRSVKKQLLITANAVAGFFLAMTLAIGALTMVTSRVEQRLGQKKRMTQSQTTDELVRQEQLLEKQIERLSSRPDRLNDIMGSHNAVDWAAILNHIRTRTPRTVRITELRGGKDSTMYLGGLALSYEAVHLFSNLLNKSDYIESASLTKTVKDNDVGGLVRYTINCVLAPEKEGG
ncbi:MAG: pilus assembly protein PilM [Planctomycetota bacterium]|jgi:hypothetical protein